MRLRVAHSPDADDAFMMRGFVTGAVEAPGLEIELVADDIERLNQAAGASDATAPLDVCALSFAAWPHVADRWDLLPVGSSFGLGWGPRLVARQGRFPALPDRSDLPDAPSRSETADLARLLEGCVVAIPGERTTAALLLALLAPSARTRVVPFLDVAPTVARGDADCGIVIHEAQLTYERDGLVRLVELGEWWSRETGGLPLPLGANAIRANLPNEVKRTFADAMRRSIEHALSTRDESLRASVSPDRGLDADQADRYVAMYVNDLTLDAGDTGRRAVAELYRRGAAIGRLPDVAPRWAG